MASNKSIYLGRLSGPRWKVEAAVLPNITTKLPASPISFNRNWRHLSGLPLADPDFGVPGKVEVLLWRRHVQSCDTPRLAARSSRFTYGFRNMPGLGLVRDGKALSSSSLRIVPYLNVLTSNEMFSLLNKSLLPYSP